MSDPPFSDIDFKNKKAWVRTTLELETSEKSWKNPFEWLGIFQLLKFPTGPSNYLERDSIFFSPTFLKNDLTGYFYHEKAKLTPVKSKIKPLPKVTNFRTLKKEIIPERLKMGRCRTAAGNHLYTLVTWSSKSHVTKKISLCFQFKRCVTEFEKLNRIGEGTYGIVYRYVGIRKIQFNRIINRLI